MEKWKPVKGYEGFYEVSDEGRVRSLDRYTRNSRNGNFTRFVKGRVKKQSNRGGYLCVTLNRDGKYKTVLVHRLVALAFLDNPSHLPQVNHKDENKRNNRVDNLEWCTAEYNVCYGTRTNRMAATQSRAVIASKDGHDWKRYPSLMSTKADGMNPSNVKYACDGRFSTMYGFTWRWAD